MKKANLFILLLIVLSGILGIVIFQQGKLSRQKTATAPPPTQKPEPITKPIIHYPVPEPDNLEATTTETGLEKQQVTPPLPDILPPVEKSDEALQQVLMQLVTDPKLFTLLNLENFIQRFVVFIDNLPEKRLPRASIPIEAPGGRFLVSGTGEAPQTSGRNHQRYQKYVKLLENIDSTLAIKVYTHFYPLFQRAYEQLGYKSAYFNDRLIFTLDHLLETPDPKEPILLAQPGVLYTYADPLLENCSAGQKILIRSGPENRARVLAILAEYRSRLSSLHP
jgi:hypothetical protein